MTLYGESPIWSYFKPKVATSSAPPLKKRKVGHSETASTKDSDQKVVKGKEKERGTPNESTSTHTRPFPVTKSMHSPRTPNVQSIRKRKGDNPKGHFPTPPTTNEGPSRRQKSISLSSSGNHSGNHEAAANEPTRLLPTPLTLPRHLHRVRVSHDGETPSKLANGFQPTPTADYVLDNIPSSQSQPELYMPPGLLIVASFQNSKSIKARTFVNEEDHQSTVQSSQSQPPLRIPNNYPPSLIATNKTDARQHVADAFFESIPSSQSQEIELGIPEDVEVSVSDKEIPSARSFRESITAATNPHLPRTFSDDIFPIPVNHSLLSDIFQEDEQDGLQPNPDIPKYIQDDVDDSATESESEDDEKILKKSQPRLSKSEYSRSAQHRVTPPLQESAYDASQEDASLGGEEASLDNEKVSLGGEEASKVYEEAFKVHEDDPSILQSAPDSSESSFESLPPELREIFGNSDDSYPPDFPMSLR